MQRFLGDVGAPVVMKPSFGTHGTGVVMDIATPQDIARSLATAGATTAKKILMEQQVAGTEYRMTATRTQLLAVTLRKPAHIVGDGERTVRELIDAKNANPARQQNPALKDIPIDEQTDGILARQNSALDAVPGEGETVFLRTNSNISAGGDSIDFTDKVHAAYRELAPQIVRAIPGLPYAGIDVITPDVERNPHDVGYFVIEINASPMISMHHYPYEGRSRDVAAAVVDEVFALSNNL